MFPIVDQTMTTVRKKLFFFFPDLKKYYYLRQRWIRFVNREGWKLECYETGAQRKRYRLVKKLNPVPAIFDPEESHLSAESKYLKSPVSVPRKSTTKRVYQQDQFKLFEESKDLMILILR